MSDLPSDELRGRSRGADVDVDAAPSREQLSHGGARADELSARCAELEAAVDALRLQVAVRERLLTMVAAGGGRAGIARGVHEVTGLPVAVEDSYGNLGAWAGPGRPDPYPKASPAERDDLLHRAGARRSWREDGRLVALAREGEEVLGLIALVDPDGAAGDAQRARLEDGALVLAVELAHQREMAASELRLRGSLVDDLVAGVDPESARNRARSLGYDLERPHRVIVVQGTNRRGDGDLFHAVRRAARDTGVGSLLVSHGDVAVLLAHAEVPWEQLRDRVLAELGGGHCRLGVGGLGDEPGSFPRSYHEARLALALQESTGGVEQATDFDELGVYRLLSEVPERGTVRDFVDRWLGSLLAYDERKGSQLVETLGSYLDHGGNYDATAAARSLHRSTLRYRLQRIREVSGLDLHDPDTRFNLHLATRAWRTFDARQRI